MSRHRLVRSLVLPLTVVACAQPAPAPVAPPDPAALTEAIQSREREWSAAFLASDAAGVAGLYTEGAASVQATGDWARGREGITKLMQAQFDTIAVTAREDITEEVLPAGAYLVEIGHYSFEGTSKATGKPASGSGRYMVLWRQDADGVWRIHRDIGNNAPAKQP